MDRLCLSLILSYDSCSDGLQKINNLSFQTLWIEIQFAKKTIGCATDKTKPLLSPTMKKEQLPICQSG